MTASARTSPALLIDIGGVLVPDHLTAAAWGNHLGIAPHAFLAALFAGNDDQILIGRVSEAAWWRTIADRLHVDEKLVAAIRADLVTRRTWNTALLARYAASAHGRRSPSSATPGPTSAPAWPAQACWTSPTLSCLSCEVGYAKPDPRIYAIALHSVRADPADALFIDDTPEHVDAATSLGMTGHVHTHTGQTLTRIEKFVEHPPDRGPA
jgi:putative hydrolase of the HAD superfamily